jgi:hypothetical protein
MRIREEGSLKVYVRVLAEPFSAAEVIEIETRKCSSSCQTKREQETALPESIRHPRQQALMMKHKRR